MSRRVEYATAGRAVRYALLRAATAEPRLRQSEWRVLAAVVSMTGSWSRLTEKSVHDELARLGGFDPVTNRRQLQRALHELADRGIIAYRPARHRGDVSTFTLPTPPEGWSDPTALPPLEGRSLQTTVNGHKGGTRRPPFEAKKGGQSDTGRAVNPIPEGRPVQTTPYEKNEKDEKTAAAAASVIAVAQRQLGSYRFSENIIAQAVIEPLQRGWTVEQLETRLHERLAGQKVQRNATAFLAAVLRSIADEPPGTTSHSNAPPSQQVSDFVGIEQGAF